MPEQPSFDNLTNQFIGRYFQVYDYRYSVNRPPLDQAFYNEVLTIIKEVYPYIVGFSLERIYDFVKKKLLERIEKDARVNLLVGEKMIATIAKVLCALTFIIISLSFR